MAEFWQTLVGPPIAQGDRAVIDLVGTEDPSGFALAVTVSNTTKGPPTTVVPTLSTPGSFTIRVTLTAAQTALLTPGTKYGVVRRTDAGFEDTLANFKIEIYNPSTS